MILFFVFCLNISTRGFGINYLTKSISIFSVEIKPLLGCGMSDRQTSEFQNLFFPRPQFRAVKISLSKIRPVICYCLSLSGAFSWKQSCSSSSFDLGLVASSRYSGCLVFFVSDRDKRHVFIPLARDQFATFVQFHCNPKN